MPNPLTFRRNPGRLKRIDDQGRAQGPPKHSNCHFEQSEGFSFHSEWHFDGLYLGRLYPFADVRKDVARGDDFRRLRRPVTDLDLTVCRCLPNHYLHRYTDQVGVFELDARTLCPVIIDDLDSGGLQVGIQALCEFALGVVGHVRDDQVDLERRDAHRPDQPVLVVAHLCDRREDFG